MLDAIALSYALHLAPKGEPADLRCLAEAVYYEAKTQTVQGQLAVAQVVLNRRKSFAFPSSICAVVYQKRGKTCQFSWTCNAALRAKPKDPLLWAVAEQVAVYSLKGQLDPTRGATYFHATHVKPNWRHLKRSARIGGHIFYTDPSEKRLASR